MANRRLISAFILLSTALVACTSTEERYATADQLLEQGFYEDAAAGYIRVLQDDQNFPGARDALAQAGGLAVDEYVSYARESADREDFAEASQTLDRVDGLRARARAVRVNIRVPEDYGEFRMSIDRSAVEELRGLGDAQAARGNYGLAIDSYERARRYARDTELQWEIDELQGRTWAAWGEADMDRGHYRSAAGRFDEALGLLSENSEDGQRAFDMRAEAFILGTVSAAFLPVFVVEAGHNAPSGFAGDLENALLFDYWSHPPPFIETVDPSDLRRIMRIAGIDALPSGALILSELGDLTDADLIVVAELADFSEVEKNVTETRLAATMSDKRRPVQVDTAFSAVESTLEMSAQIIYTVMDRESRELVDEGTFAWTVGGPIEYGHFVGNANLLNLSAAQKTLFDPEAQRDQRRVIERLLVDELAASFADRVFGSILRTIP
ncbi:MAG: hypothetical protein HKO53_01610 [Gemmatimonadetes bacterium]|nr:hypothetical protein [Gemmatimonadota bacterium]